VGCAEGDANGAPSEGAPAAFANPQRVTLRGYRDDAMEPALSRDGRYLFFNNSNEPAANTDLHWAERIDDLTFQYKGEVVGVNTAALEGVPSMDRNGAFYFVSTRSYERTASTIYRAAFANGTLSGVELVPGISAQVPGRVNFDAEISPDGNTLYFVDSAFEGGVPKTADISLAERSGAGFVRVASSAVILQQINTAALEYAPAISGAGLEIFFTRAEGGAPAIYTSTRLSTWLPFGAPRRIEVASGFVEAPSLSFDEKSLYYHKKEGGQLVLYRVSRP
jgi:Tol biopolymer transport system component